MTLIEQLRTHARLIAQMAGKMPVGQYYQLLVDKGVAFTEPRINTYSEEALELWHRIGNVKKQQCWRNAALFALCQPGAKYYEGIASGMIPCLHAWNVLPDGRHVDFTWDLRDKLFAGEHLPIEPAAYFGVEVPIEQLHEWHLEKGHGGPVAQWAHLGHDVEFVID